ncbi:hypothetical protein KQX54_009714 [Cotesia glomerata]|uniref:Uncharacterized protein n=1 Tax=Cotesia glomerata TaxID=32391 RepID=A0AAV7J0F4_COTGL|nr:hypothetical protein KQX54_009714 [Cotesia glomerata]
MHKREKNIRNRRKVYYCNAKNKVLKTTSQLIFSVQIRLHRQTLGIISHSRRTLVSSESAVELYWHRKLFCRHGCALVVQFFETCEHPRATTHLRMLPSEHIPRYRGFDISTYPGHLVEQRIGELTPDCSILDTKQVNTPPPSPPLAPTVPTEPTLSLPLTLPYSAVQSPRRCNCTYISQHPTYILNYYYHADWTGTTTQLLFQSILMNDPVGQIAWYVTPA